MTHNQLKDSFRGEAGSREKKKELINSVMVKRNGKYQINTESPKWQAVREPLTVLWGSSTVRATLSVSSRNSLWLCSLLFKLKLLLGEGEPRWVQAWWRGLSQTHLDGQNELGWEHYCHFVVGNWTQYVVKFNISNVGLNVSSRKLILLFIWHVSK